MNTGLTKKAAVLQSCSQHQPVSFESYPFLAFLEKYLGSATFRNCLALKDLKKVHAHAITVGLTMFTYITSRIMANYVVMGDMENAHQLFIRIPFRSIFNWNTMIRGFAKSPNPQRGLFVYIQMRRDAVNPNMHSFPFVVKACGGLLSLSQVHAQTIEFGFNLDVYVTSSLIRNYSNLGDMEMASNVFHQYSNKNIVCWTSLISGYFSHGLTKSARDVFDKMPEKNIASWSAMISGYVQNEQFEDAMELFLGLKASGQEIGNKYLLVSALTACAALGAFAEGRWIHSYVDSNGIEYGLELGTALLNFYAKCGLVEYAREVFDKMPAKDVTCWSAMISSFALNGFSHSALQTFSQMLENKVMPNAITFIGVLIACNHGGLVDAGRAYFKDMSTVYGICPLIKHYGCMVDLLSRAGHIKEAEEMIVSMPMEPDGALWGALLNGCFMHQEIDLGERVGKHVIELEPDHSGRYVGLANLCASMGMWEVAAMLRSAMEKKGVTIATAWSLVEVDRISHRFLANDHSHPMVDEIYQMLTGLSVQRRC
ncbi:hypothetical protein HPP92_027028 [Vanilla planifolia]|uniref:Pentatricopeptide repeat-containing protein n=1 Tax=Vanilla planifolia TaxID=51239 RepID=A0A835PAQ8_VANPL|nr:hypothetical protein HPP92_027028 [Vanilla planifolia]